jgi:hypothetical protein
MYLQSKEIKENKIYRQNYCGCIYALNMQREDQNKLCDELMNPINKQILPESIESRIKLYNLRNIKDKEDIPYHIIKERFLNYRLLSAKVISQKTVIPSYFIYYSTLQNDKTQGKIEYSKDDIYYLNKNEVKIIDLEKFNKLTLSNYANVKQLMQSPLKLEDELHFRNNLLDSTFDLSCLIILDTIPKEKIKIFCKSKLYEDVREKII